MTEQISLDTRSLEAALAVLRREQGAYLPTKREIRLYKLFCISVWVAVAFFVVFFAALIVW